MTMTPNEYQQQALRTENTPYFAKDDKVLSRLVHAALGLASETGELQDALKKHLIYNRPIDNVNVLEECGDVLWYLALALDACGFTLEEAMEKNIAKLKARYGGSWREDAAVNRDLAAERRALEGEVLK